MLGMVEKALAAGYAKGFGHLPQINLLQLRLMKKNLFDDACRN
jgi:hypothetical protein